MRHACSSAESSVDLPAPGGPVIPITCPGASPPSAWGETSRSSAADCSRSAGGGALQQVQGGGRRAQVALAQARAEGRPVVAHASSAEPFGDEPLPLAAGGAVADADQLHDVAHDAREVEVLGRVHAGHAGALQRRDVLVGDDPADDHGRLHAGLAQRVDHGGDQLAMRAGEDRQADHVHALLQR